MGHLGSVSEYRCIYQKGRRWALNVRGVHDGNGWILAYSVGKLRPMSVGQLNLQKEIVFISARNLEYVFHNYGTREPWSVKLRSRSMKFGED